jgi:polyisoprenoid-binding protein YceI
MKRTLIAMAALVASASPVLAAHWNVDGGKSKLGFTLPWGKQPFVATFGKWQADIEFDSADLAHSHVLVTVPLNSETSGDDDTDDALKSDQGFGVANFPTAKFETKSFQHLLGNNYAADGVLTIRGIAKPTHMTFTLVINGADAHMAGDVQTKWADYGLGQEMGKELPEIGTVVTIHADITAKKS